MYSAVHVMIFSLRREYVDVKTKIYIGGATMSAFEAEPLGKVANY